MVIQNAGSASFGLSKVIAEVNMPRRSSGIVNTSVEEIGSCATAGFFLLCQSYGGNWRSCCASAKIGPVWFPHPLGLSWFFGVYGLLFMSAEWSLVFPPTASLVSIVRWRSRERLGCAWSETRFEVANERRALTDLRPLAASSPLEGELGRYGIDRCLCSITALQFLASCAELARRRRHRCVLNLAPCPGPLTYKWQQQPEIVSQSD